MPIKQLQLAPEVKQVGGIRAALRKFWSLRLGLVWAAVSAMLFIWPALLEFMGPRTWAGVGFVMAFSIIVARLLNQPGSEGV